MKKILSEKKQKVFILTSIFLMMLVLNFLTPLLADDFSYSFGVNGRIKNIMDILSYQVTHYLTWGGRSIAHTIAQIFLLFPKAIFNIVNSLIYTLLVYIIYLHIKSDKEKPYILIIIHLLIWFLTPVFGQNCIWLIGSCNYLWTTTLILIILLPFRNIISLKDNYFSIIAIFLLGILSGWTNENTSVGLIAIELGLIFFPKKKIKKWQISGLAGSIIGFLVLILAPGNYARNAAIPDKTFIVFKLLKRTMDITNNFVIYIYPLFVLLILLISIYIYKKKKISNDVYIFAFGSFMTTYSMALSPTFPLRSWFGVIIFLIIANGILIYNLADISKLLKFVLIDIIIIATVYYLNDFIILSRDINQLRQTWNTRIYEIKKAKSKKKSEISIKKYITVNTKNPAYDLSDIGPNADEWPNTSIAKYFKMKKIFPEVDTNE